MSILKFLSLVILLQSPRKQIQEGPLGRRVETHLLSIPLLSSDHHPRHPTTQFQTYLHLHSLANLLVHPAGDFDETDQSSEVEGMWTDNRKNDLDHPPWLYLL